MKSIFEIENRLDIQKEFERFLKVFHNLKEIRLHEYSEQYITLLVILMYLFLKNGNLEIPC